MADIRELRRLMRQLEDQLVVCMRCGMCQAVRERLQRCLLCGSCAANCPSGVNVLEIFLKARAILAGYLGLPPPLKKAIFRMDIAQFLVQRVGLAASPVHSANGRVVTIHDSCHLKKSLGVFSEPRDLIRANPDCTLKEMAAADDCCGMGGSFNLEHYGLSGRIGRLKRDHIAAKHPVEIYAESFSG